MVWLTKRAGSRVMAILASWSRFATLGQINPVAFPSPFRRFSNTFISQISPQSLLTTIVNIFIALQRTRILIQALGIPPYCEPPSGRQREECPTALVHKAPALQCVQHLQQNHRTSSTTEQYPTHEITNLNGERQRSAALCSYNRRVETQSSSP
jgi:hypothetical protein